jgi:hypothetical protein
MALQSHRAAGRYVFEVSLSLRTFGAQQGISNEGLGKRFGNRALDGLLRDGML